MTVMDVLRSVRPGSGEPDPDDGALDGDPSRMPSWAGAVLTGVLTAVVSALLVIVPTVLAWSADSRSSTSFGTATAVGSALWLLLQGSRLVVAPTTVAFVPLAAFAVLLCVTAYGAFRVVRHRPADADPGPDPRHPPLPWTATLALGQWWLGYAVVTGAAVLLARTGPVAPLTPSLALPLVVVPAVAAVIGVAAQRRHEEDLVDPTLARRLLPGAVRHSAVPALHGIAALLAVGTLVVLVLVGLSLQDIRHVQAALGTGAVGGFVLVLAQAGSLPNLALWAVSFLAGPGFQVVDGARTTLTGSQGGLLPIVPVLAALPKPGGFPVVTLALVLVPVIVGGQVGRRALGSVARLSSLRAKASVATTSAVLTAAGVGLLDAFAGGRLGTYKLSQVGAPALALAGALAVELTIGALAVVAWDAWRLRR